MYIVNRNPITGVSSMIKDDSIQFKSCANDPFILKKRKEALEFLAKVGIPKFEDE